MAISYTFPQETIKTPLTLLQPIWIYFYSVKMCVLWTHDREISLSYAISYNIFQKKS